MDTIRRATILKLAAAAYELDLDVFNGAVTRGEGDRWLVDKRNVASLLADHEGEELVLILGSLEDDRPVQIRTCLTCGRDYTDGECPYCRESRIRLRGGP
jgi:hypothetical protein